MDHDSEPGGDIYIFLGGTVSYQIRVGISEPCLQYLRQAPHTLLYVRVVDVEEVLQHALVRN